MSIRSALATLSLILTTNLANAEAVSLRSIVDDVVARHMTEKRIPGLSVAIVHEQRLVFSKGYGKASIEFDVPADADTVYPVSSVSKMFAGLLAVRLDEAGLLNPDSSIADYLDGIPPDKRAISIRQLLQHTHGLEDFHGSDAYAAETGRSIEESTTEQLLGWSLGRPLRSPPGTRWDYGLAGYVMLGRILEAAGGSSYAELVGRYVFDPVGMAGAFGGSETVVPGRHPILYELADGDVVGHVIDFPERVWPAGGLNLSVTEMAKLFVALSGDAFLSREAKQLLWRNSTLPGGVNTNYGLGWTSYVTSRDRWVVGHEGGGASWVIYYPDIRLAVIALSNMSAARADSLPYEIARAALENGFIVEQDTSRSSR